MFFKTFIKNIQMFLHLCRAGPSHQRPKRQGQLYLILAAAKFTRVQFLNVHDQLTKLDST